MSTSDFTIGVVGNPNCGKTTLFNALTGARQRVGNWPGVTVERKTGHYRFEGASIEVVDLPGTYSLDVVDREVSLDEQIARDYVHAHEADLIVNIVDAANLERNLYLTSQLVEMQVPLVVALNMMDVAEDRGMKVDAAALGERLGCPVVPIVAADGTGIDELKRVILAAVKGRPVPSAAIRYPEALERAVEQLAARIAEAAQAHSVPARWLAVRLLEGDGLAQRIAAEGLGAQHDAAVQALRETLDEDIDILVADARYSFANRLTRETVKRTGEIARDLTDRIDRVVLNRALGIPIFLAVMYAMFLFTISIGGAFIDFFDGFTGTLLVDGLGHLLGELGTPEWAVVLLANGIGGGIQVVATFIPVIGFLYLFLSMLEDSGYMARAAFVMDRFMRWIGLPGKSFVPLIVGFGCNVPAIMATRTLEQVRDRVLTVVMAPFMSCGARLPVYALFAAAFFPVGGQNVVFGLYLIGIAVAVLTGLIVKRTLLPGEATPFVMELPAYHLPTAKGVALRTWDRLKSFLFRAGRVIVPMVLVLNVLNAIGTDGSFGNEDTDKSVLSEIGRTIAPAFSPLGLDEENWPAAVGIFTGVLAKEAVVGTLDSLYSALAAADAGEAVEEDPFDLSAGLIAAFATIPANLGDALGSWADPLGLDVGDLSDPEAAAEAQEVSTGTYGAMVARFDGTAGAFAYLLFILLYMPCVAAIAAVYQETTPGWTVFVAAWTTGIAYAVATVSYQAAVFARDPVSSLVWIGGMVTLLAATVLGLRLWGQRQIDRALLEGARA
jgi:ferrous iron transport protein B